MRDDSTPVSATAAPGLAQFSLAGHVAVVTGAAGLLGAEHAIALAGAGATVVVVDIDDSPLPALAERCGCAGASDVWSSRVDVTDARDVERLQSEVLDRFGVVDVLVNNAALNDKVEAPAFAPDAARSDRYPLDAWRRMMDVNVTGVFLPCQVFGATMIARGSGSIVNVASTYGLVGPDPGLYVRPDGSNGHSKAPAYPASKGAVLALTRHFAVQWGRYGVRVNALVPGGVRNGQADYFVNEYARRTPLGRMAAPDDYHGALVFLAGNASRYMTGAALVVDGGFTAW